MSFKFLFHTQETPNHVAAEPPANNADDATVAAGENGDENVPEIKEIRVKWVYPMTDKRKVIQSHYAILSMMLKAHPDLVIIDNKAREHTEKKTMKSTEKSRPFEFYLDARRGSTKSLLCIHRIRTSKPLAELKESWGVYDELQKHKAYVRTHAFGEKDREISHIGFIPGLNMVHVPKEHVKQELLEMIHKHTAEVPNFEIVQVRVDMGKGSKLTERTRAYEIQCLQRDASGLAKLLQSGSFRTTPIYVPYRIKQTDPATFKRAIHRQNCTLSEQWVIKLQGFNSTMMAVIRNKLLDAQCEGVIPTKNEKKGEWKVLVHKDQYSHIMKWLKTNWDALLNMIPTEMYSPDMQVDPRIASKSSAFSDSSSEGTVDTYGTILSSLYCGEDGAEEATEEDKSQASDTMEESHTTTVESKPVSYAQVVGGAPSSVSQVSGWTDHPLRNTEFLQLQENHSKLEDRFNKVTAELGEVTAELGELKSLLKQLLQTQQHTSDSRKSASKRKAPSSLSLHGEEIRSPPQNNDHMDMDNESACDSEAGQAQHSDE